METISVESVEAIIKSAFDCSLKFVKILRLEPLTAARVNRVWLLDVQIHETANEHHPTTVEMVLKLSNPSWTTRKTRTEVNSMQAAKQSPLLQRLIPHIYGFCDDSHVLPCYSEYILMERKPGVPLSAIWDELESENKESIILQLADVLCGFRSLGTFDRIGSFCLESGLQVGNVVALEYLSPEEKARGDPVRIEGPFATFAEYVLSYMNIHIGYIESKKDPAIQHIIPAVKRFRDEIVAGHHHHHSSQQNKEEEKFVFTHGDLNSSNILVTKDDRDYSISGLIDFEWALSAPVDLEYHRCLRWLKDPATDSLLALLCATLQSRGVSLGEGVVKGTLRYDIWSVERLVSHLDSYKHFYKTEAAQEEALKVMLSRMSAILTKYNIS